VGNIRVTLVVTQRFRILALIAVGILPLLVLAGANLTRQVQEGEQRVAEDRIALSRAAALTVSGFVDTSFATLQALAATSTVADPTPRPALTDLLNNARELDSPLAMVGLFRPDGWNVALAGLDQPPLTLNVLDRQYIQQARTSGRRVVSPATIPRTTGVLTVDLVMPVDFLTGGRGVLLGSLALTRLGDQLRTLPGSDTVQIVLVDADGQVILHPDPNVVRSVTSLRGRPEVDDVLMGQTGSRRASDPDGSEDLVAFAPVPGYGWGVLVVQPVSTAFAQVRRDLSLALGLLALIVGLISATGWVLGGRLQSAYTQLLREKTRAEAAQAQAEAAQERLLLLAEASRILGSSLEDGMTLEHVAHLAVPSLGDTCVIDLIDRESSTSRALNDSLQELRSTMSQEAMASGHLVKRDAHDVAGLAVPLLAGGRTLGALTCFRTGPLSYDDAEVSLATELAQRVALAVDNVGLYEAAQRAIQDRDEFLSVAAHELKTPITSLRGYAQLALRRIDAHEARATDGIRKAFEVIENQSVKLNRLVGQLLDISRLEAGRLTLTRERVDLVPVLVTLVERSRMMADQHILILKTPPAATAYVDVLRVEQVLTNLLDNAIKYSPQGGQVRVELALLGGDKIRLSVQDQGVGIPAERRGQIFERFYQAHGEFLHSALAGMGLGLYISREIVELHGGTIEAEFPAEGGVRFVLTLPVDGSEAADDA
jgi:signal transduction histidine kinase